MKNAAVRFFVIVSTLAFLVQPATAQQPTSITVSPSNLQVLTLDQAIQFKATSNNAIPLQGARAVSAGASHTCALLSNGNAACWGSDSHGELGNGFLANSSTPVSVDLFPGTTATAVSVGYDHSCALISNGTIQCWGDDTYGQLGSGILGYFYSGSLLVNLPNGVTATAVSSGDFHSCALLSNGGVECWGWNLVGQLGNGTFGGSYIAPQSVSLPPGLTATGVAAGGSHTCALLSDGSVQCWGNYVGNAETDTPVAVNLSSGVPAISISSGEVHTCALLSNGTVQCWNDNTYGELGNGTTGGVYTTPQSVSLPAGVTATAISAGYYDTCALLSNGSVQCWGWNEHGELGTGAAGGSYTTPQPVALPSGATAASISTGWIHTCVVISDGTVQCWGDNSYGELGNGTNVDSDIPVVAMGNVVPSPGVRQFASGPFSTHVCAAISDGSVQCWGTVALGGLGNSSGNTNSDVPVAVTLSSGTEVNSVATGNYHSCAVVSNGSILCWGYNAYGQLGDGNFLNSNIPVPVSLSPGETATAVAAGHGHTCALLSNGTVQCWGENGLGQAGNGVLNPDGSSTPSAVELPSGVTASAITAGGFHTCALVPNGSILCWGSNSSGQVGNGGSVSKYATPQQVSLPSGLSAVAVAAGFDSSCALLSNGTVLCWGDNSSGQLGNGSLANSSTPVVVGLPPGVATAVSAGDNHACALLSSGSVQCWGDNSFGQLGNGAVGGMYQTPQLVSLPYGTTAKAIIAGTHFTCALLSNGSVQCWGDGSYGQLGNGTYNGSNVPVATDALVTSVAWTSSMPSVATIDPASGAAMSVNDGSTLIMATYGSLTARTMFYVGDISTPPIFFSANAATFTTGVASSFEVNTGGTPTPSLSETATLPSGLFFTDNGYGIGTLGGTPAIGTGGIYTLTFVATNGSGSPVSQVFTLTVDQAPSFTTVISAAFAVGKLGAFTPAATGFPAPVVTESGPLPTGVTFSGGVLSGTPSVGTQGNYNVTLTATSTSGVTTQNFVLIVSPPANFVGADTTTQGNWMGVYGADGYDIAAGPQFPSGGTLTYGNYSVENESEWTWGASTSDPRALETNSQGDRIASTWYSPTTFSFDVNFTDTNPHEVALYVLDWDRQNRAETVQILDASNPSAVLDTRSIPNSNPGSANYSDTTNSNFQNGTYLVWTLSGHVTINIIASSYPNGVVAGIFFGGAPQAAPSFSGLTSATFTAGTAGSFTVNGSGYPLPSMSEAGALPNGVTFVDNGNGTGTLQGTPVSGSNGSYPITFTAMNSVSTAQQSFTLTVSAPSLSAGPSAAFVKADTSTQGNWMGTYGGDSYDVAGGPSDGQPSYGSYAVQDGQEWTWAAGTSDPRALQIDSADHRIAATWYNGASFSLDVDVTDGNTHPVALYVLDWDHQGRTETVQVVDADNSSSVLDTRMIPGTTTATTGTNFQNGTYLSWEISGHVTIIVTCNGGPNAVVSGIFFGGSPQSAPTITSANAATFTVGQAGTFTVTAAGMPAAALSVTGALPSAVQFIDNGNGTATLNGTSASGTQGSYPLTIEASNGVGTAAAQAFTLTVSPTTPSSITSSNGTTFTAGTSGTFTVTVTGNPPPTFGETGTLPSGVTLASTGVLSGTPATNSGGTYPITITASNGVGIPATQSFTLAVNTPVFTGPSASFVGADKTTQGNWIGTYGGDGYDVASGPQAPAGGSLNYGTYTVQNASSWTWASSTSEVRALEIDSQGDRIAAAWYNTSFSFGVNFTDTSQHQVALYLLDWDHQGRSETVQLVDAANPNHVLDTRAIPDGDTSTTSMDFPNGVYLVWNVSGNVTINITYNEGPNAVVSGIFFGSGAYVPSLSATASFGQY